MEDKKLRKNLAEEKQDKEKGFIQTILWLLVLLYLTSVIIVFSFNRFSVVVDGSSMMPTLKNNDFIIANSNRAFNRGDIVIIDTNLDNNREDDWVVKRIIGLPGETITIESGKVYIGAGEQKKILKEDYVSGLTEWPNSAYIVGEGEYFYLGDNRAINASFDSRLAGNCKSNQIIGVVEKWSLTMRPISNFLANLFRG